MAQRSLPDGYAAALAPVRSGRRRSARRAASGGATVYLEYLTRWWWALLLGLVLGALAVVGYLRLGPLSYQSMAYVQVVPPADMSASDGKLLVANMVAQAQSPFTRVLVSHALQGKANLSSAELDKMANSGKLAVGDLSDTNFIRITVSDTSPARAELIANTYAKTFADQVDSQYQTQLATQAKQLQQQIDDTEQNLVTAQLQQREQTLNQQLRDQRAQLLSVQGNYLQMLQSQVLADKLSPGNGQPAVDPAAAQKAQQLQAQMEANLQATVKQVQTELDQVNAAIAAAPDSSAINAAQSQLSGLMSQQQSGQQALSTYRQQVAAIENSAPSVPASSGPTASDIAQQINAVQAKLSAAQVYKQELTLQGQVHDLQVQLAAAPPEQQPALKTRLADAQNQLAAATDSYKASGFTEFTPSNIDANLQVLQSRLTALLQEQAVPPTPIPAPRPVTLPAPPQVPDVSGQIAALQAKIASAPNVTELLDEKHSLESDLANAKNQLFQLQQNDIQKLATTPAKAQTPSAAVQALGSQADQARSQWQQQATTEQVQIQKNIDDLTKELTTVQGALAKLPAGTDLTLMSSMADSYDKRLHALSDQYVQVTNDQKGQGIVQVFGSASAPILATGTKKIIGMGVGGGLAIAAALTYGIDWYRRYRQRPAVVVRTLRPGWPNALQAASSRDLGLRNGYQVPSMNGPVRPGLTQGHRSAHGSDVAPTE